MITLWVEKYKWPQTERWRRLTNKKTGIPKKTKTKKEENQINMCSKYIRPMFKKQPIYGKESETGQKK